MSDNAGQWLGQVVDGKFELREYLGGSPSGWVFLTEREEQKAAIKLIPAESQQADARISRLEQVKKLSHPNLIRLYETGRCRIGSAALIYAVMEFGEENLAEILPQRALAPSEATEMLPPVLDALAYLHDRSFAHGHVKPSNILAIGNQVKISSDGICAIGEAASQPSAYDAPEVASRGCSAAADAWSLGMTLVETLTQQLPRFEQNGADELVLPGPLPQPFLDIARNCLQQDAQRRWRIADISARLRPSSTAPRTQVNTKPKIDRQALAKPQKSLASWRHAIPAAVLVVLALIVILVAPKVLNRLQGQAAATSADRAAPEPTAKKPAAARVEEPKASNEATGSDAANTPDLAAPAESEAPAKAPSKSVDSGEVTHQVVPDVPQKARDTIQGTVKVAVRVQIDPSGEVTDASLDSPGPSKYFANLAVSAAREWKFTPSEDGGAREWILRFQFTQDGTRVIPTPARPRD
jgi:TonB family protein